MKNPEQTSNQPETENDSENRVIKSVIAGKVAVGMCVGEYTIMNRAAMRSNVVDNYRQSKDNSQKTSTYPSTKVAAGESFR